MESLRIKANEALNKLRDQISFKGNNLELIVKLQQDPKLYKLFEKILENKNDNHKKQ